MPAYFFRSEPGGGAAAPGTARERACLPAGSDDREPARGDSTQVTEKKERHHDLILGSTTSNCVEVGGDPLYSAG